MTNSEERQRRYVRKHYETKKAEGKVKCSFWLEPVAAEALEAMMAQHPELTKAEVINRSLVYTALQTKKALDVITSLRSVTE